VQHLWTLPDTPSGWIPFGFRGKVAQKEVDLLVF
jgi:hypothetical protein